MVAVPGRHQSDIIKQLQDFGVPHSKIWRVSKSEIRQTKAALSRRAELLNAILNPAIQLLNDNTIPYFATNSFLLSIVRGDHPASFADLDILYEINYGETIKNEMISRFPSEDITIIQDNTDESVKKMIIQKGSLVDPICDPAVIDLHPLTMGSDFAFWTANQRVKKIPIHFFKTQKFQHVNGLDISIPNNAEDLLTLYYGNDWQEPHEYWDGIFDFERNTLF
ncbi:MAG: hypothetical protein MJE63_00390 [Proteobacteria bacterium]|nr:hypothetical protein [Pseudomonadota bacterium]